MIAGLMIFGPIILLVLFSDMLTLRRAKEDDKALDDEMARIRRDLAEREK